MIKEYICEKIDVCHDILCYIPKMIQIIAKLDEVLNHKLPPKCIQKKYIFLLKVTPHSVLSPKTSPSP
jgi:hypothetical protein